jgi:hypothetical protein
MKRVSLSAALVAALAACFGDIGTNDLSRIVLFPVLNTLFVGDGLPQRRVTYYNGQGTVQDPGTPTVWFTAATNAVFDVDSATGKDSARAPGGPIALIAHAALNTDTVQTREPWRSCS